MFNLALGSQLSAIAHFPSTIFPSLPLAVADAPTSFDDRVVTIGAIALTIWIVSLIVDIWSNLRPARSLDERIARALERCAGHCGEKIAGVAADVDEIKEDRRRNVADIWKAIDSMKDSVQGLASQVNRALGRLEGRAEIVDELKKLLRANAAGTHEG